MTKEEVYSKIKMILVEELDVEEEKVTPDVNIQEDLDIDSLDLFDVIDSLEDEYDIEIDTDENEDIQTLDQLSEYVLEQINNK
ncbi:MAG: acyl carrier protein [Aerococcus sp.]|nr:acyl carrier protein [Aerococcus sp.]